MNIMDLLSGMLQPQQAAPAAAPQSAPVMAQAPMSAPANVPIPTPRPSPGPAPAPSANPQRAGTLDLPAAGPMPAPRPEAAFTPAAAPAPVAEQTNPFLKLFSGTADTSLRDRLGMLGAGLAAIDPKNDDPYSTFGKSLSGATTYANDQEKQAYERSVADDLLNWKKSQADIDNSGSDADRELRRAVETRLSKAAGLDNEKTALEIKRLADGNGLTVSQMLEIERISQAAGEGASRSDRSRLIEEKRNELLKRFGQGPSAPSSEKSLSGPSQVNSTPQFAKNPQTGERLTLDPKTNQWVPVK